MGIAVWTGCTCAIVRAERTMASSMSGVIRSAPLQLRVAPALFAALAVAPSCAGAATILPNGTYVYETAENGKGEATSTVVVTRTPGEIVVTEHSSPMEAGEITRRSYDAATLAAHTFDNAVDGHAYTTVNVDGTTAMLVQGGRKTTLTHEKPATLWYDPVSYVLDEFDVPAQRISFVLAKRSDAVTSLP